MHSYKYAKTIVLYVYLVGHVWYALVEVVNWCLNVHLDCPLLAAVVSGTTLVRRHRRNVAVLVVESLVQLNGSGTVNTPLMCFVNATLSSRMLHTKCCKRRYQRSAITP